MSCEHAQTTTLLWAYGEGPEEHGMHVARCPECTEVLALHADVLSAVPPQRPIAVPEPANTSMASLLGLAGIAVAVSIAATGLLAVLPLPGPHEDPAVVHEDVALRAMDMDSFEGDAFDIDRELDVLLIELETL